ncbi:transposase [Halapricum desulfuricans]|uniref:IS4 transposase n=1 Tax=Halapricum desulfuricans TaxID=2841257 RepID=A0A897N9Y7_9EURY|nr:transposase [Halapricum desulfuricans]QSG09562.1 IS4 transposase [Halapricum desulfuricans]
MTITTGVEADKHDPFVSRLPVDRDQTQSIDLLYNVQNLIDIHQIQRANGSKIGINYPVENAESLGNLKYIESQFAAANAINDLDPDLVDTTILRAMPDCLAEEGVVLPDDPTLAARVKALIFKEARGMQSRRDLLEYLDSHLETAKSLGLCIDPIKSESTYSRAAQEWRMDRQSVQDAISRLQHFLFRNGYILNWESEMYTENQPIPHSSQLPDALYCQGMVNYTDLLLRRLGGISFKRGTGNKYSPREIIGSLAQLALHENPTKARQLSKWHYESDLITMSRVKQIISNNFYRNNIMLAKSSIESLDKTLHQILFKFANNLGLYQQPIDIALDPTWVPVTDNVEDTPGAIKNPTIADDAEGGFTYPMAVSVTPMSSFSLGVKFVTDKSQYHNAFRQLLSRIKDFCDIGWIFADREFDSANMISLLRSAADKKWIIRVREHNKVITPGVSRSLEKNGKAQVSIGNHNINVFSKEFQKPKYPFLEEGENMILLSDMPIEDTNPSLLVKKFFNRWGVETYIREIKHDFSPKVNQEQAPINQFMFTIASVFYNIWRIINQSTSPIYGLPLQPRYYDVLKSIVQSTFASRHQIQSDIDKFV